MCYSAQLSQSLSDYLRQLGATPDFAQIEEIFRERLTAPSLRIPRGFERNFDTPASEPERRIRALIDQYRNASINKYEQEVFAQKRRLADAERKLKTKSTKAALNEQRIASSKIDTALEKLALLKGTQPHMDDERIFPFGYAPIVLKVNGRNVIRLARYHLRQADKPASIDRQFPGLYNARRDNIEKFWRNEFGHTHALMLVSSFYENVQRDGANAVLHFIPRPAQPMFIASLYAEWRGAGESLLSFAAVTDDPPDEVRAAGHDRMIVNIKPQNIERWLTPEGRTIDELQLILSDRQTPYYEHQVAAA
jgi:putative SOS response-associated peptidase YedK